MKSLFIINDPPYGTERAYNALRRSMMRSIITRQGRSRGHPALTHSQN
jgi:sulfur relay (sulfurtransferase) complex TusBCD TusD component (DsrE family)